MSEESEPLLILCATWPNAPLAPVTIGYESDIIVSWQPPFNNGSPIESYRVYLQTKENTYAEETVNCLSTETIVAEAQCTVPLEVLYAEPYNLVLGDSVYAKVLAGNFYGEGPISASGNGATIVLVPHPPVQLVNDAAKTNA